MFSPRCYIHLRWRFVQNVRPATVGRQKIRRQAKKQQVADGQAAKLNLNAREKAWSDAHLQVRRLLKPARSLLPIFLLLLTLMLLLFRMCHKQLPDPLLLPWRCLQSRRRRRGRRRRKLQRNIQLLLNARSVSQIVITFPLVSKIVFFSASRFALMRWCLLLGSSIAPMGTKSARPASKLKPLKSHPSMG